MRQRRAAAAESPGKRPSKTDGQPARKANRNQTLIVSPTIGTNALNPS